MRQALFFSMLILLTFSLIHCAEQAAAGEEMGEAEELTASTTEALVKRGEYLVTIMGCHDCHSPKRMGPQGPELIPELLLSGHPAGEVVAGGEVSGLPPGWAALNPSLTAAIGPWGVSFAANLTPDETGIGNWTEVQFRKALTEGKSKGMDGTRLLLPPMPWQNFAGIQDEDLSAIFAYLKSTEPVSNVVPAPISPGQATSMK